MFHLRHHEDIRTSSAIVGEYSIADLQRMSEAAANADGISSCDAHRTSLSSAHSGTAFSSRNLCRHSSGGGGCGGNNLPAPSDMLIRLLLAAHDSLASASSLPASPSSPLLSTLQQQQQQCHSSSHTTATTTAPSSVGVSLMLKGSQYNKSHSKAHAFNFSAVPFEAHNNHMKCATSDSNESLLMLLEAPRRLASYLWQRALTEFTHLITVAAEESDGREGGAGHRHHRRGGGGGGSAAMRRHAAFREARDEPLLQGLYMTLSTTTSSSPSPSFSPSFSIGIVTSGDEVDAEDAALRWFAALNDAYSRAVSVDDDGATDHCAATAGNEGFTDTCTTRSGNHTTFPYTSFLYDKDHFADDAYMHAMRSSVGMPNSSAAPSPSPARPAHSNNKASRFNGEEDSCQDKCVASSAIAIATAPVAAAKGLIGGGEVSGPTSRGASTASTYGASLASRPSSYAASAAGNAFAAAFVGGLNSARPSGTVRVVGDVSASQSLSTNAAASWAADSGTVSLSSSKERSSEATSTNADTAPPSRAPPSLARAILRSSASRGGPSVSSTAAVASSTATLMDNAATPQPPRDCGGNEALHSCTSTRAQYCPDGSDEDDEGEGGATMACCGYGYGYGEGHDPHHPHTYSSNGAASGVNLLSLFEGAATAPTPLRDLYNLRRGPSPPQRATHAFAMSKEECDNTEPAAFLRPSPSSEPPSSAEPIEAIVTSVPRRTRGASPSPAASASPTPQRGHEGGNSIAVHASVPSTPTRALKGSASSIASGGQYPRTKASLRAEAPLPHRLFIIPADDRSVCYGNNCRVRLPVVALFLRISIEVPFCTAFLPPPPARLVAQQQQQQQRGLGGGVPLFCGSGQQHSKAAVYAEKESIRLKLFWEPSTDRVSAQRPMAPLHAFITGGCKRTNGGGGAAASLHSLVNNGIAFDSALAEALYSPPQLKAIRPVSSGFVSYCSATGLRLPLGPTMMPRRVHSTESGHLDSRADAEDDCSGGQHTLTSAPPLRWKHPNNVLLHFVADAFGVAREGEHVIGAVAEPTAAYAPFLPCLVAMLPAFLAVDE